MHKYVIGLFVAAAWLPTSARADQFQWLDLAPAVQAQRILADAGELRHFCQPCHDKTSTTERIETLEVGLIAFDKRRTWVAREADGWLVYVNGRDIDLAYVYVRHDGEWRNLALLLGLPASGVSPRLVGAALAADAPRPLADGDHRFVHRFAEHPDMASIPLLVRVAGDRVQVIVEVESDVFPRGVLDEGTLFLHPSNQWIVAAGQAQMNADEVGGCSDGPAVIDPGKREYWTC